MSPIKVMIVDDSAVVRRVMVELLGTDPGIEVIAAVILSNSTRTLASAES